MSYAVRNLIAETWSDADGEQSVPVWNPSLGIELTQTPLQGPAIVDRAAEAAAAAFPSWSTTPPLERAAKRSTKRAAKCNGEWRSSNLPAAGRRC